MKDYLILKNIEKHISLSNAEKERFISALHLKNIEKKNLLLRQGQLCKSLYFVESGSLRAFNINEDGKESTIMFAVTDWWVTDMYAFAKQKPALVSIEAIHDSRLMGINFEVLEELFIKIPKLERLFRILFQNAYIREQLRVLNNISLTTEERYHKFVEKYPQIVDKITQKQIASYLGVTPEFLSTVKKNKRPS